MSLTPFERFLYKHLKNVIQKVIEEDTTNIKSELDRIQVKLTERDNEVNNTIRSISTGLKGIYEIIRQLIDLNMKR